MARVGEFGLNSYNNNMIEDEEEYWYHNIVRLTDYGQKDLSWLLHDAPLSTVYKLAYMVVAFKYRGHGTAMSDLKKKGGFPISDPCTDKLLEYLCDCREQAAMDIGRGRQNPKVVCIGHPCFGITTDKPSSELGQEEERIWFKVFGCSKGQHCPRGYCTHIRGVAGLHTRTQ